MPACKVDWCERSAYCRGYCRPHYKRLLRYGSPLDGGPYLEYKNKGKLCLVEECDRPAFTKGLCSKHYRRAHLYGNISYSGPKDHRFLDHKAEWKTWDSMRYRCYNANADSYKYYGGRGIKVCDRWLGRDGFVYFLMDMGPRPNGCSLDRIDPDGDYCPENCRWANIVTQQTNRRNNNSIPGVRKRNGRWISYIAIHGNKRTKTFATKKEAISQRKQWEMEHLSS